MSIENVQSFIYKLKKDGNFLKEYKNFIGSTSKQAILFDKMLNFAEIKKCKFNNNDLLKFWKEFYMRKFGNLKDDDELAVVSGGMGNFKKIALWGALGLQVVGMASPFVIQAINNNKNSFKMPSYSAGQIIEDQQTQSEGDFLKFFNDNSSLPEIDENHPYNEVDALLFSTLVYLPLTNDIQDSNVNLDEFASSCLKSIKGEIKVNSSEEHTVKRYQGKLNGRGKNIIKLLEIVSKNPRYKNIKIGDAKFKFNKDEQFAGVTFTLPDGMKVVTFRGTDGTVSGWKENFDMGWSDGVLSQKDAANYLKTMVNKYSNVKFATTGHSKGGHLSYFSAFSLSVDDAEAANRILSVDNFDGPGIRGDFIQKNKEAFDKIKNVVHIFSPQDSLVGALLTNNFEGGPSYKYIKSDNKSIMQHDNFSWHIADNAMNKENKEKIVLYKKSEAVASSKIFEETFKTILSKLNNDQLKMFSNTLFKVFGSEDPSIVMLSSKGLSLKNILKLSATEISNFINVTNIIIKSLPESMKLLNSKSGNEVASLIEAEKTIIENKNIKSKIKEASLQKAKNTIKEGLFKLTNTLITKK